MSVFTKNTPIGIDKPIQAYQSVFYNTLKKLWNLTDTDWNCYGRVYRNQTEDGYTPEAYIGNGEYQEVFFDDTLKALSFFGVGETIKFTNLSAIAPVYLIMMVNIPLIKPAITGIADEEIRNDVQNFCRAPRFTFEMQSFETGLDTVFKEYSGWRKKDGIKYRDQYPLHCFRINFNLIYNIGNN